MPLAAHIRFGSHELHLGVGAVADVHDRDASADLTFKQNELPRSQ